MKILNKSMRILVFFLMFTPLAMADALVFEFGNPAFSGNGYSSHVLSVEQLQYSRKQDVKADEKSAAAALKREQENTTIAKFIKNVESRIYANLSKQLVDNMFGTGCDTSDPLNGCQNSGTTTIDPDGDGTGAVIAWIRDETAGTITLTVTAEEGTLTNLTVPIGNFLF